MDTKVITKTHIGKLNPDTHLSKVEQIGKILDLIAQSHRRLNTCIDFEQTFSFLSSPFTTKTRIENDIKKWSYITHRLERYYLKKLCELNSLAYKEVNREIASDHLTIKAF